MLSKTKDYEMFIFRDDNRAKIDQVHVNRLIRSIQSRNLLEFRPILVNKDMEVIDGQHRLLAAKSLGLEIYYKKKDDLDSQEVMLMNTSKSWLSIDYLNFYCKNNYQEYKKLADFMKKNNLSLRICLNIVIGRTVKSFEDFKNGKFIFKMESIEKELELCWSTIETIRRNNGYSNYLVSSRFWRAMLSLFTHEKFNADKWNSNLSKMVQRFSAKATTLDYKRVFMEIYNYRSSEKINLIEGEF